MTDVAPSADGREDDPDVPAWVTDAAAGAGFPGFDLPGPPESPRNRLERHLDLLVTTELVIDLAPPDLLREQTLAAWEAAEADLERTEVWSGWVFGVVLVLGSVAGAISFAWLTVGPPEWSGTWLWALVAPVAAVLWALPLLWLVVRIVIWVWDRDFRDFDRHFPGWEAERRRRRVRGFIELVVYALLALLMWWSASWLLDRWPGGVTGVVLVPVVLLVGIAVIVFVAASIVSLDLGRRTDVRDELLLAYASCTFWGRFGAPLVPYAEHLLDRGPTFGVADITSVPDPGAVWWRRDREARRGFAVAMEGYGDRISADAATLAPRRLRETRAWLRDYGRRVAASLVDRGRTVILGSPAQDDEVIASLASDWALCCQGRWSELSQAEPPPLRKRLVETLGRRVGVAAVLVVAALVLAPMLGDAALQSQVRGALIGAAVLALITPRAAVEDVASSLKRLIEHT